LDYVILIFKITEIGDCSILGRVLYKNQIPRQFPISQKRLVILLQFLAKIKKTSLKKGFRQKLLLKHFGSIS